ncbi:short-chain dehydrogenase [Cryptococcus wingfieldii CBS 7118]|uniref:Short-chain dehydrogenase n=1 Tax=Cryptococcus wingfieldii CBS 7118 TaxID=1295528 RepID=A0A1E3HGZ9_9TREE|nr:short-chain dehydrogenase [Cryptococcus wingfieldii CBS 7118]ODN75620.1 short-chain dehydrogenase [Cryptococcus wingfieldii CBS 7118]
MLAPIRLSLAARRAILPSPLRLPPALHVQSFSSTSYLFAQKEDNKSDKPQAAHFAKDKPRPVSSGKAVSEHAVEKAPPGLPEDTAAQGGGRGLGLTIAQSLLESGANVVCLDLLATPSEPQWSHELQTASSSSLSLKYISLDVTDQSSVTRTFQQIFDEAPADAPVRGLFVAAGIQLMLPAVDYPVEKFRKVVDINLTGSFLCAQAFARERFARFPSAPWEGGGSSIVFTASMSAHVANKGLDCVPYNASKAAVLQMAKNLAYEWGQKGVRVNTLSPGYIKTALTAALLDEKPELNDTWLQGSLLGRLSTPDEFRGPVIYLLSDASSFMTGADLLIDGGHCAT